MKSRHNGIKATLLEFSKNNKTPPNGLPAAAYTNNVFWKAECDTVFLENWVCVGFVHEFTKAGDVVPVSVGNQPLLIVRNITGKISAFHNVCRHRCLKLVEKPKNVGKLIQCPYHAWSYDLNGNLRASPHFGGTNKHTPKGFNQKKYGLLPVRTAIWNDWIFVNLNGKAPSFEKYAEPLINSLKGINFKKVRPVATLNFGEISTNWKFIMENFIEPYHVQFVHKKTSKQPLKDHYTIVDGVCLGSGVDMGKESGVDDGLAVSSRYLTLFPNFIVGRYFPDQLGVYLNVPIGPNRTIQKRIIYTTEGKKISKSAINTLKKLWWDVHKEDHEICERLQLGRASLVAQDGGILSPYWEKSVYAFHKLVIKFTLKSSKLNGDSNYV